MACIIALIVFSILGLFSATHRQLAREALDCVFRKATFRPCNTGFKEKVKGKLVGGMLTKSAFMAKILNRYFELFSFVLFMLMIASTFYVVKGGYNYYKYGSCNGLNKSGFCVFDPTGGNNQISAENKTCSAKEHTAESIDQSKIDLTAFPSKKIESKNNIVFIGCYNCDYSRKSYPIVKKLVEKEKSSLTFIHFPTKDPNDTLTNFSYCASKNYPDKFWDLNDKLFASKKEDLLKPEYLNELTTKYQMNPQTINECATSDSTKKELEKQKEQMSDADLYGTPTVFINGKTLVGPKPYRVYKGVLVK
ncbi:MAG: thioredoxin domain-containing protein [Patescibacteria group bacterium]|jgi:protein-disulfide isomerase